MYQVSPAGPYISFQSGKSYCTVIFPPMCMYVRTYVCMCVRTYVRISYIGAASCVRKVAISRRPVVTQRRKK